MIASRHCSLTLKFCKKLVLLFHCFVGYSQSCKLAQHWNAEYAIALVQNSFLFIISQEILAKAGKALDNTPNHQITTLQYTLQALKPIEYLLKEKYCV